MTAPAEMLWRVNNEYRKRLTQVTNCLNLLEQLVLMQQDGSSQVRTLAALRYAREEVEAMAQEHRDWRYRYYYDSTDSKRMVQGNHAVHQALARFSRMRVQHDRRLGSLRGLLDHVQRPNPDITRVATGGDLWTLTEYAIHDLSAFDAYLREMSGV